MISFAGWHIVNGDALKEKFIGYGVAASVITMREALIEGPLQPVIDESFFEKRAHFISETFDDERSDYFVHVVDELAKIHAIDHQAEINLWFENDLFCQVNLWFLLQYLHDQRCDQSLFRIVPSNTEKWTGFGSLSANEINDAYNRRISLDRDDVTLGLSLWDAYSTRDEGKLLELSRIHRKAFPHLEEVVHAQMERFPKIGEGRPQRVLREIRHSGVTAFPELFQEFSRREAIYGFGDIQILNMLKSIGD